MFTEKDVEKINDIEILKEMQNVLNYQKIQAQAEIENKTLIEKGNKKDNLSQILSAMSGCSIALGIIQGLEEKPLNAIALSLVGLEFLYMSIEALKIRFASSYEKEGLEKTLSYIDQMIGAVNSKIQKLDDDAIDCDINLNKVLEEFNKTYEMMYFYGYNWYKIYQRNKKGTLKKYLAKNGYDEEEFKETINELKYTID